MTVGALVTMAAHLEGKQASVLDFMGFAQKGGAVLSFVRLAPSADQLNQVRIDTQQADLLLACDMVVGASPTRWAPSSTAAPWSSPTPTSCHRGFVRHPDAELHADALLAKLRHAAGDRSCVHADAQAIAQRLLGDTLPANIVMLGVAFQHGLVPVGEAALQRAIELNGVAVAANRPPSRSGDWRRPRPTRCNAWPTRRAAPAPRHARRADRAPRSVPDRLPGRRLARRYRALVDRVRGAEAALGDGETGVDATRSRAVRTAARGQGRVRGGAAVQRRRVRARHWRSSSRRWDGLSFHMAPPLLARRGADGRPHKIALRRAG